MDKMLTHKKTDPNNTSSGHSQREAAVENGENAGERYETFYNLKTPLLVLESNSEWKISQIKQTLNLSLEKQRSPAGDYVGLCLH